MGERGGGGTGLGVMEGGEVVVGVYCMKEESTFNLKRKREKNDQP